jgi:class 3 adenylate cyclase
MTRGEQHGVSRRLAAILAADVAGYSRLMEADEVATLRALKAHRRELIDPAIASHHGRIVKSTGDGVLVEFQSIVDAVTCAVAVQRGMIGRNITVPEDRRIVFRIGINVRDILSDGDDIFGDGVNVAARLVFCTYDNPWRGLNGAELAALTRSQTQCREHVVFGRLASDHEMIVRCIHFMGDCRCYV